MDANICIHIVLLFASGPSDLFLSLEYAQWDIFMTVFFKLFSSSNYHSSGHHSLNTLENYLFYQTLYKTKYYYLPHNPYEYLKLYLLIHSFI